MKSLHVAGLLMFLWVGPAVAGEVENQVLAKEKSLWVAWQKRDAATFRKALTADSVQIITNAAPIVGPEAIIKAMFDPDCTLRSYALSDEGSRRLAPDVVMLTYTATQDGSCGSEAFPKKIRATAIYVRQKGQWLESQYQETPIK